MNITISWNWNLRINKPEFFIIWNSFNFQKLDQFPKTRFPLSWRTSWVELELLTNETLLRKRSPFSVMTREEDELSFVEMLQIREGCLYTKLRKWWDFVNWVLEKNQLWSHGEF
jgi:hypothetical protein